jgi:hypothetical protein
VTRESLTISFNIHNMALTIILYWHHYLKIRLEDNGWGCRKAPLRLGMRQCMSSKRGARGSTSDVALAHMTLGQCGMNVMLLSKESAVHYSWLMSRSLYTSSIGISDMLCEMLSAFAS